MRRSLVLRRAGLGGVGLAALAVVPVLAGQAAVRARLPSLSISSPAAVGEDEGATKAIFAVRLSAASRQVVSVRFKTSGLTAAEGADYRAAGGTLVFKPGERLRRVVVAIEGDSIPEDDESFFVTLSRPRNARLRRSQATGRIAANDLPAPFTIVADLKANDVKGTGTGQATIRLDAARGEATFRLEVRNLPRDPVAVHIHSRTGALTGGFPSLLPLPSRDGTATGTAQMSRRTILLLAANIADFYVSVHTRSVNLDEEDDLSGDLHRAPGAAAS